MASRGESAGAWPEDLAGALRDGVQVVVPAGERAVGQVREADVQLVAAQALAEGGHVEAGGLVMPETTLRDGVGAAQRAARLDLRNGQVRPANAIAC
jgi:hypothetical protein